MMRSLDCHDTHNNHHIENTSVPEPHDSVPCWHLTPSQPAAPSHITTLSFHHKSSMHYHK